VVKIGRAVMRDVMAYRLDVEPVWIERAIIIGMIMRPIPRRTVAPSSGGAARKNIDIRASRGEGDMGSLANAFIVADPEIGFPQAEPMRGRRPRSFRAGRS
jgi:hypothetical protein